MKIEFFPKEAVEVFQKIHMGLKEQYIELDYLFEDWWDYEVAIACEDGTEAFHLVEFAKNAHARGEITWILLVPEREDLGDPENMCQVWVSARDEVHLVEILDQSLGHMEIGEVMAA